MDKKLISCILIVLILLSQMPLSVLAEEIIEDKVLNLEENSNDLSENEVISQIINNKVDELEDENLQKTDEFKEELEIEEVEDSIEEIKEDDQENKSLLTNDKVKSENYNIVNIDENILNVVGSEIQGFNNSSDINDILSADILIFPNIVGVDSIGKEAFQRKGISSKLVFPESYKNIGKHAFKSNNIIDIEGPGLEYIGEGALEKNKLTKIDLPKVTEVDVWAFEGNQIEVVKMNNLKKIGDMSFANNNITKFEVPGNINISGNPFYPKNFPKGIYNLSYEKVKKVIDGKEVEKYYISGVEGELPEGDEFKFPEKIDGNTIYGIKEGAFLESKISGKLIFPESYKEIGKHAFKSNNITDIEGPGLEYIGEGALEKNKLAKIDLPKVTEVDVWAFEGNIINSIDLPLVESIGDHAFSENKITSVKLPKVKEIGVGAFEGNEIEGELSLPLVGSIGDHAFSENKIISVKLPKVKEIGVASFEGNEIEGELNLPLVESIGDYAFSENKIISVKLPKVKEIGVASFKDNEIVGELNLPEVKKIWGYAFQNNKITGTVTLKNLETAAEYIFDGKDNTITSIDVSKELKFIHHDDYYKPDSNKEPENINHLAFYGIGNDFIDYYGYLPIYIEDTSIKNKVDNLGYIVYNPTNDFKETIDSTFNKEEIEDDYLSHTYLWNKYDPFIMAMDEENNSYYCIDKNVGFNPGFYLGYEVDRVYIKDIVKDKDGGVLYQDISFEKPDNYIYSYSTKLASKVINSLSLVDESSYDDLYLLVSNESLASNGKIDLSEDNFLEYIELNHLSEEVAQAYKNAINDKRDYTQAYIYLSAEGIANSQTLIKPGTPAVEEDTEKEEPKEKDRPSRKSKKKRKDPEYPEEKDVEVPKELTPLKPKEVEKEGEENIEDLKEEPEIKEEESNTPLDKEEVIEIEEKEYQVYKSPNRPNDKLINNPFISNLPKTGENIRIINYLLGLIFIGLGLFMYKKED